MYPFSRCFHPTQI